MAMAGGKGKRKQQQATNADRGSKRPQLDDEGEGIAVAVTIASAIASSSTAPAPLARRNGDSPLHGSPEDATSDAGSVSEEPPPLEASTQSIETQGQPPTEGSRWKFSLEESPGGAPGGKLTLPAVPTHWKIFAALPREEERAALPPEAMIAGLRRALVGHRMVG